MKAMTLSLETLSKLSPDLNDDFNMQLESAIADCRQRPSLPAKREVLLKLVIYPHPQDPDDVMIEPVTQRKTPTRKINPIHARRTAKNQLQFDFMEDGESD